MGDLKWVEGRDYGLDVRYGNDNPQTIAGLADELVASRPDLLLTPGDSGARLLKQRTTTIPIVFAISVDPVGNGLIDSLGRPGGNVTGTTNQLRELGPKRVQMLKEAFPKLTQVGVLFEPNDLASTAQMKTVEEAGKALGLRITLIELRQPADVDPAIARVAAAGVQAFATVAGPLVVGPRPARGATRARTRLPAIYTVSEYPGSGGLMSYGPNVLDNFRRAAGFVDKIHKGALPGDLPTQQPTQFELVINMKTARALGLAIPQAVLLRTDRMIE